MSDLAFDPVSTKNAAVEISTQIRERLARGALKVGDKLPSGHALAGEFQICRNTLRQALRSLETSGLIEIRRGAAGGAFIRDGGSEAVLSGFADLSRLGVIRPEHLGEARIAVGTTVARLACARRTTADLCELERNIEESEAAVRANDLEKRAAANFEFHRILARSTKNPVFVVLTDAVIEINRVLARQLGAPDHRYLLTYRRRILKSISECDAEKAAQDMERYLKRLERFYHEQERGHTA